MDFFSNIPWPSSWEGWCAVLGFALSLYLAIRDLFARRLALRISNASLYRLPSSETDLWFLLVANLSNLSSSPASVLGLNVRIPGIPACSALFGEHVVMGVTSTNLKTHQSHRSELLNTPLPFNFAPLESREICAVFHLKCIQPPQWFLLHPADIHPEHTPISRRCAAHLVTPKRLCRCRFRAVIRNSDSLRNELRRKTSLRLGA